jgi:hypothetical protein
MFISNRFSQFIKVVDKVNKSTGEPIKVHRIVSSVSDLKHLLADAEKEGHDMIICSYISGEPKTYTQKSGNVVQGYVGNWRTFATKPANED